MDGAALDRLEPRIEGVAVRHRCGGEALWVTASLVVVGDANVRCIYLYIVVSPYVRGLPAYLHLYVYYKLWPLAPR
jgi:hypothetical protein